MAVTASVSRGYTWLEGEKPTATKLNSTALPTVTIPNTPQTVTGSRASGAALADLLTKLAATNIIIDGTTA